MQLPDLVSLSISLLEFELPVLSPGSYWQFFIVFLLVVFVWENYLLYRQWKNTKIERKPAEITWASDAEFQSAQNYGRDQVQFAFLSSVLSSGKLLACLSIGLYPQMWEFSTDLADRHLSLDSSHEIAISLIYYFLDSLLDTAFSLPLSLYSTFVLEAKHGFNRSTLATFFADLLKSMMLSILIGFPLIAALLWTINYFAPHFFVYCWLFVLFVQLAGAFIYPTLIQPLFNTVKPLEQGPLRTAIEELAAELKFPVKKLFVIDGSRRSAHSNAYLYGFWGNKRIVLFDTLIGQVKQEELVAVLAHEIGHWFYSHTTKLLLSAQVQVFTLFFLFGKCISTVQLYRDFGFTSEPVFIGLMLFQLIYSPVQHVLDFLSNVLSRRFEYQADQFAVDQGRGEQLKTALIKLQKENKSSMIPDPLYSAYHHSHPNILQRLRAIADHMQNKSKKTQ